MATAEEILQTKSVSDCKAALRHALLDPAPRDDVEFETLYAASRDRIRRFLRVCKDLPDLPPPRGGMPKAGLDDSVGWCDAAERFIEKMPLSFDPDIVTRFIDALTVYEAVLARLSRETIRIMPKFVVTLEREAGQAHPYTAAGGTKSGGVTIQSRIDRLSLSVQEALQDLRDWEPAFGRMIDESKEELATIKSELDWLWERPTGQRMAIWDTLTGSQIKQRLEQTRFEPPDIYPYMGCGYSGVSYLEFAEACLCRTAENYFDPLREAIGIFDDLRDRIRTAQAQAVFSDTVSPEANHTEAPPAGRPGAGTEASGAGETATAEASRVPGGDALTREEAIAVAESIRKNLDSLCTKPVNPPPLDETRDKGVYLSEPNRYWNQNGPWLYEQGTKKLVGRTLERRDIEQATHGLEALRRYLETNIPEWADEINTASDEIPDEVAVIYSQKRAKDNPLIALRNKIGIAIGMLRRHQAERAAEIELQKPVGPPPTPETLSSIIPDLRELEGHPVEFRASALTYQAHTAARCALEKKASRDEKRQIERLFAHECDGFLAIVRNALVGSGLTRQDQSHWDRQFVDICKRTRQLLHESLSDNTLEHDRFNELHTELKQMWGGLSLAAGTLIESEVEPGRLVRYRSALGGMAERRAETPSQQGAETGTVGAAATKTEEPTPAEIRAWQSYAWICEERPGLIDEAQCAGKSYTEEMHRVALNESPSFIGEEGERIAAPNFDSWKRNLRGYIKKAPKKPDARPDIRPEEIATQDNTGNLANLTNRFESRGGRRAD